MSGKYEDKYEDCKDCKNRRSKLCFTCTSGENFEEKERAELNFDDDGLPIGDDND